MGFLKGQSAIEYLTTYGWMFLVVAVAGSAIYANVSPGCSVSVQSGPADSLMISQIGIEGGDTLTAVFRNAAASVVEIDSVSIEGRETSEQAQIDFGGEERYKITAVNTTGDCHEYSMSVAYDTRALPNLEQKFTVRGRFTLPEIVVEKLLASGDTIEAISTRETVMPTGNSTMCFGEGCASTDGGELTGSEKYINISGDSMQGTLNTDSLNADCYGDLCTSVQTSDLGYVSSQNNTLNGTLNVTEVKPLQNLCIGGTC